MVVSEKELSESKPAAARCVGDILRKHAKRH